MKTLTDLLKVELRARLSEVVDPLCVNKIDIEVLSRGTGAKNNTVLRISVMFKTEPHGSSYTWGEWVEATNLLKDDGLETLIESLIKIVSKMQASGLLSDK